MVNNELLQELDVILQEDFGITLTKPLLEEVANTLLKHFETLIQIHYDNN